MLTVVEADKQGVVHRVLVLISIACCALVALSFLMFARDQMAAGSKHQQNELIASAPSAPTPAAHRGPGQPRKFIDDAAKTLTSPFDSIVQSDSQWAVRGLATIAALLVYGVGLGYLARFTRGMA